MSSKYHSASHAKYLIQYHIIWCPKFRFSVLTGDIETKLKEILQNICVRYSIKALEVMPDHIHLFIDCPQTVAPCEIVRTLKSLSAIALFNLHPRKKCGVSLYDNFCTLMHPIIMWYSDV